jgi:hypothetical protein
MTHISRSFKPIRATGLAVAVAVAGIGSASAHGLPGFVPGFAPGFLSGPFSRFYFGPPYGPKHGADARDDYFTGYAGWGPVKGSVLFNDYGLTAVVNHDDPKNGTLEIYPDGSFTYTPKPGFKGTDKFTYSATNAVQLFLYSDRMGQPLPALAEVRGPSGTTTKISREAYGSALTPVPFKPNAFYGLTDRGPNADAPDGRKSEMVLDFVPQIGELVLFDGQARLVRTITLKGPRSLGGHPYSGLPTNDTPEIIDNVDGTNASGTNPKTVVVLPRDPLGYDSEGLVALPDGTFWVSDEYGPYVTHFDASGYEIGRLTPYVNSPDNAAHSVVGYLPAELARRLNNKGMEGLTVTPDGKTLVGIMQSALQLADLGSVKAGVVTATRIVTIDLKTYATKQYLYLLDDPAATANANSEITALSSTKFVIDERDGNFEPGKPDAAGNLVTPARKSLYLVDIAGATDVSNWSAISGLGGLSPEAYVGAKGTQDALAAFSAAGVRVANVLNADGTKKAQLQLGELLRQLNPAGALYAHDKVEGVATTDGGRTLYISNDSDFAIDVIADPAKEADGAWTVHQKTLPSTGQVDFGEILKVDTTKLPAAVSTAEVTIVVR